MTSQERPLLNEYNLNTWGNKLTGVPDRLAKRAGEVRRQVAGISDSQLPTVDSLVYARPHSYRYFRKEPLGFDQTLELVQRNLRDIKAQEYPFKGTTIVAVTGDEGNNLFKRSSDILRERFPSAQVVGFDSSVSHAQAYNRLLTSHFDLPVGAEANDLLHLSELGGRMLTDQAFNAAALTIGGNNPTVAVQGSAFASRQAGLTEGAFYTAANCLPRFAGWRQRPSVPGPGYLAANRSIISYNALAALSYLPPDGENATGPFNAERANGGFDGALGETVAAAWGAGAIALDHACSITWQENPARGLRLPEMAGLLRSWMEFGELNMYVDPQEQ